MNVTEPLEDFLGSLAVGLDLTDSDDRAEFRTTLARYTRYTTMERVVEWARTMGVEGKFATKGAAQRALAEAWITKAVGS